MSPAEGYISLIQEDITSWITAQHIVEVTVGKRTSWGFDARLDATTYYQSIRVLLLPQRMGREDLRDLPRLRP